jgi:mannosyl-oligosaccharide alpha-1,2-mannosidase
MHLPSLFVALALVGSSLALPQALPAEEDVSSRAAAVKEAFSHAWDGYMKYAFPHDELHPISNGYGDSR